MNGNALEYWVTRLRGWWRRETEWLRAPDAAQHAIFGVVRCW